VQADEFLSLRDRRDELMMQLALFRLHVVEQKIRAAQVDLQVSACALCVRQALLHNLPRPALHACAPTQGHMEVRAGAERDVEAADGRLEECARALTKARAAAAAKEKAVNAATTALLEAETRQESVEVELHSRRSGAETLRGEIATLAAAEERRAASVAALSAEIATLESKLAALEREVRPPQATH